MDSFSSIHKITENVHRLQHLLGIKANTNGWYSIILRPIYFEINSYQLHSINTQKMIFQIGNDVFKYETNFDK